MEPHPETKSFTLISSLGLREAYRDKYWRQQDPILKDRLLWRAQTFRHTVHLLPGETILELGCGELRFTRALLQVSRNENPITSVTFQTQAPSASAGALPNVEVIPLTDFPGVLAGRQFDYIVGMDLLDRRTSSELLEIVHQLLSPGGEIVFYESNPWNPVLRLRGTVLNLLGKRDPRNLIERPGLYELLSEIGFIRIYAVFNDFVFAPLTRPMIWFLRNVSILLENAPLVRTMAGSILVHAQKPPRMRARRRVSLSVHNSLRDSVSVVIPCHNEEMNIRPLVKGLSELYGEYVHEFILLDDGSTDRTREVISALARENARVHPVYRGPPHGVGRAIADGLAVAKGHYVLTIDCDFQHLLPEFRDLFESVAEGYDVVIGSRFSRHSVLLGYPFLKILANRAFHTATDILFWRRLRDLTNNLKIMRIEVAHRMILRQPGFAVNAETGLEPVLLGYRVKLVPISWINRTPGMGTSSFRLRQVGKGYWSVLSGLWWWYYFGTGPYAKLGRPACEPEHLPGKIAREQRSAP